MSSSSLFFSSSSSSSPPAAETQAGAGSTASASSMFVFSSSSSDPLTESRSSSSLGDAGDAVVSSPSSPATPAIMQQTPPFSTTTSSSSTTSCWETIIIPSCKFIWKIIMTIVTFLSYDRFHYDHHNDDNNGFDDNEQHNNINMTTTDRSPTKFVWLVKYTVHMIVKTLLTIISLFSWYTYTMGHMVGGLMYLIDHHWWILVVTTSIAILLVSLIFTISYEWMWRWQESCCGSSSSSSSSSYNDGDNGGNSTNPEYVAAASSDENEINNHNEDHPGLYLPTMTTRMTPTAGSTRRRQQRQRRRFVVTVDDDSDDDDLPFLEWIQKLGKKWLPGILIWIIYSIIMTKFTFVLWTQYDVAHHNKHGYYELRFVNTIMSFPFLLGAGFFHVWYFPSNRHTVQLHSDSSNGRSELLPGTNDDTTAAAMQSLI